MKISSVEISNFQAITHIDLQVTAPVVLIAGANEQGKTSLLDAVRFAVTGQFARVARKQDLDQLVRDGAKIGAIGVGWDSGGRADVALPAGDRQVTAEPSKLLPLLLSPGRIATLPAEDLRTLLFRLGGVSTSVAAVREKLLARKHDSKRVDAIATQLHSGFEPAHAEARTRAREARASWKATTGETYGEVKAKTWKALEPEVTAEQVSIATAALDDTNEQMGNLEQEVGALRTRKADEKKRATRLDGLKESASLVARRKRALEAAEAELATMQPEVEELRARARGTHDPAHAPCPSCGVMLTHKDGAFAEYVRPENLPNPEAVAALPMREAALKLLQTAVANCRRDLGASEQAATEIAVLAEQSDAAKPVSDADLTAATERVDAMKDLRRTQQTELDTLRKQLAARDGAEKRTADAAGYHEDVVAWERLAAELAPDGIPGEMLTQALTIFNEILRDLSIASGFHQVTIAPDLSVRSNGRAYGLCSQSAQWRADAQLAAAVAKLSKLRIFALDEFDVLDLPMRQKCLIWLHRMAEAGEIDTAFVVGTLKALPSAPATFQCVWIDGGEITRPLQQAA
jgi:hypothetical protein